MSATSDLFDRETAKCKILAQKIQGGDMLYAAGEAANAVYLVRRGLFTVMRDMGDNRMQLVGYVRPGECVGEMSVLTGLPHGSTVTALRDGVVEMYPAADFLEALRARPDVAAEIAQLVVQRSSGNAVTTARA
jgi:NTE family protein